MSISGINGSYYLQDKNKTENTQRVTDTSGKPQKAALFLRWLISVINTPHDKTINAESSEPFGKNRKHTSLDATKTENNQRPRDIPKDLQLARALLDLIKSTKHTGYGSDYKINIQLNDLSLKLEKEEVNMKGIRLEAQELKWRLKNNLEYTKRSAKNYGTRTHSGSQYSQYVAWANVRYKAAKAIQHNNIKFLPRDIQNMIRQKMLTPQN